jgi:predicted transcriptional regulator
VNTQVLSGPDVRRQRESLGLTRQQLAQRADCSLSHLAAIEAGYTTERSRVIERVAVALDAAAREVTP